MKAKKKSDFKENSSKEIEQAEIRVSPPEMAPL